MEPAVQKDLEKLGIRRRPSTSPILDVAIIGAGQSGMSLCLALWKRGPFDIQIFDQKEKGFEGPWPRTARMLALRSGKEVPGPALDIPSLHFKAWYESLGKEWGPLGKIPTHLWSEYLHWYREVLDLPIQNKWSLLSIDPKQDHFDLSFNSGRNAQAKTIVLATGRDGFGGFELPTWAHSIPKSRWNHTGEEIDPQIFRDKKVCVVGAAASAFDAAAVALENGAFRVDMTMRRAHLPTRNPLADFSYWSTYSTMSDEERIKLYQDSCQMGTLIPPESLQRMEKWKNFSLLANTEIDAITPDLEIWTNRGVFRADPLIFGTGYAINIFQVPELTAHAHKIRLWGDLHPKLGGKFSRFPYLGDHFEFREKTPNTAPYLKRIYCFNYGAFLSHGRVAGDIDQLPIGIERLADGISQELRRRH